MPLTYAEIIEEMKQSQSTWKSLQRIHKYIDREEKEKQNPELRFKRRRRIP